MKHRQKIGLFVLFLILMPAIARTAIQLKENKVLRVIKREISGIRAKGYVVGISQYNRTDGAFENTDYEEAVKYVMGVLEDAKVEEVLLHTYPSDGIKTHGTWRSNPGFRVKKAELYVVKPVKAKWCDYSVIPVCLMPYSNGNEVIEAEVIYIGKGNSDKDYDAKNVEGKIVFVDRGDAATVMREAVMKRGAIGILMGFSGNKRLTEFPNLVEVNRLYLSGEETKSSKWGFSLSKEQTETLKGFLKSKRKVKMRVEVKAETFSGNMPVISAAIEGSLYPEQEVIYMAHLDHYKPGANDNASGCAGLMEIATTLTRLINENKIQRPLRTIRFLWVPEWEGTAAFIEQNREAVKRGILGINLDMIGENLQECQTVLYITRTPLSQPSFLDALIEYFSKYVDGLDVTTQVGSNSKFNYRVVDYMGGSDHLMFNDSHIGVPSTMIAHLQDRFWHTSLDTPNRVDLTELERSILLGTFLGWTAASYDEKVAEDMLELVYHSLVERFESSTVKYESRLKKSGKKALHVMHRNINAYYNHLHEYGKKSLESILKFGTTTDDDRKAINDFQKLLKKNVDLQRARIKTGYSRLCKKKGTEPMDAELTEMEQQCRQMRPKNLMGLSISFWLTLDIMKAKGLNLFMDYDIVWEMLNFADGEHNLLQIRNAVSAQFREVPIKAVKILFEELEKRSLVSF